MARLFFDLASKKHQFSKVLKSSLIKVEINSGECIVEYGEDAYSSGRATNKQTRLDGITGRSPTDRTGWTARIFRSRSAAFVLTVGSLQSCDVAVEHEGDAGQVKSWIEDAPGQATGLIPPTPEQRQAMDREMIHTESVKPNRLGMQRINEERARNGLPPLLLPPATDGAGGESAP